MVNKEIRDILLRRIVQQDDQFWMAAPPGTKFHFHGVRDGAGDVRLFGVTHLTRRYQTEMEPDTAFAAAERALYSMGRPIRLASVPGAKACFYTPNWIAPVLLTVQQETGGLQMTAYTGRSLVAAGFRSRIALWILRGRLPEGVLAGKGAKLSRAEAKQAQKEAGQAQKEARQVKKETKQTEKAGKRAEPKKRESAKRAGKRVTPKQKAAPKRLKK